MGEISIKEIPLTLLLLAVAAAAYRLFSQSKGPNIDHIPIARKELGGFDTLKSEYGKNGFDMLREGYAKVCVLRVGKQCSDVCASSKRALSRS
jgi:hypothetical protein